MANERQILPWFLTKGLSHSQYSEVPKNTVRTSWGVEAWPICACARKYY